LNYNSSINIELEDINGYRPLHQACKDGLKDKVNLLLKKRANVNALCINQYTPLHYLVKNGIDLPLILILENVINEFNGNLQDINGNIFFYS
jgi:ankyrin repeat protein